MATRATPDSAVVADKLHSAAIHVLRLVRREDVATGVSPARLSALSVLVFGGPRTVGELAEAEQVRSPTMSGLVAELEKEGLVERQRSSEDGRAVLVKPTPRGRRVLQAGRRRRVASLAAALDGLAGDDLVVLERAATLMEEVVRGHAGPPVVSAGPAPRRGS